MLFNAILTVVPLVLSALANPVPQDDSTSPFAAQAQHAPMYPSEIQPFYPAQANSRALPVVYDKCKTPNTVALTFDDGPGIYEPELLATLAKYNAKATFFLNGNNYRCIYNEQQVKIVRAIYNAGHQIGSHTWSHPHLAQLSWDQVHSELWKIEQALIRIVGVNPLLMRPPYGEYNNMVLSAVKARNQSVVLWDFDNADSTGATPAQSNQLYDQVAARRPSNLLALNHSVYNGTVQTVAPHALSVLSKKGYKFVTVSQCLGLGKSYQWVRQPEPRTAAWTC